MAAHRYWRLLMYTADTSCSIAELQLRETPGGANVATGGTASSNKQHSSYPSSNAFDGNTATFYDSGGYIDWISGTYIAYDLGAGNEKDINEVAIYPRASAAFRMPFEFEVQYSDDNVDWTTKWHVVTPYPGEVMQWYVYTYPGPAPAEDPTGAHSYWMLRIMDDTGLARLAAMEIEFRATHGGADQANGGSAYGAPRYYSSITWAPPKAFDNNTGTGYLTSSSVYRAFLAYAFPAPVKVKEVAYFTRVYSSERPTEIRLLYSDDGDWWHEKKIWDGLNLPVSDWTVFDAELSATPTIFLGSTPITGLKLGSSDVQEVYLGSQKVWPA